VVFDDCSSPFVDWYLANAHLPTIISSVKKHPLNGASKAGKNLTIYLDFKTPLPLINRYLSPETLGSDRLANACGAGFLYPNQPVLVIDAGTCLKMDIINSNNEYLGGSISVGLNMRFKAIHTFTDKLPLLSPIPFTKLYGRDTTESILAGGMGGMLNEIEKAIEKYNESFPNLKIILTGGDAHHFEPALKNAIFAPHLTLYGLESILTKNVS
jgi:type III pantothenate kinase